MWGDDFQKPILKKNRKFHCVIFSCYYCSIDLKRQLDYSATRLDTSSLVYCLKALMTSWNQQEIKEKVTLSTIVRKFKSSVALNFCRIWDRLVRSRKRFNYYSSMSIEKNCTRVRNMFEVWYNKYFGLLVSETLYLDKVSLFQMTGKRFFLLYQPIMSHVSPEQVSHGICSFESTGVNYFGPIEVKFLQEA